MCVYTAQPQSPGLVPPEAPEPTNRRFPFSRPGINRKVPWDCGLTASALPLISSDSLLRTESLQHRVRPAVSAQERLCCGMRFCGLQTTSRSAKGTPQRGYGVQLHLAEGCLPSLSGHRLFWSLGHKASLWVSKAQHLKNLNRWRTRA